MIYNSHHNRTDNHTPLDNFSSEIGNPFGDQTLV